MFRISRAPFLSLVIVLLQLGVLAVQAEVHTIQTPNRGQCVADPFSKNYVSDVHLNPVQYTCVYRCMDNNSKVTSLKVHHSFTRDPLDLKGEMTGMVCDSVSINVRYIGEAIVVDSITASAFWGRTSERPEIKKWAVQNQITVPESVLKPLREQMNRNLIQVAVNLQMVDKAAFPEFHEASIAMLEIASQTALGNKLLKESLARISAKSTQKSKAETMLDMYIQNLGGFLL